MKRHTAWFLGLVGFMALLFGCLVGLFPIHNSDVWWHIAWGNAMLQQHTLFPAADYFYFTPTSNAYLHDLPNAFLGNIGLALLYRWGGTMALQLLVLACLFVGGAAVILIPLGLTKGISQEKNIALVALLLFFGFCLGTSQLHIVRNSIISLAFFPASLALYNWHCRRGGWWPLFVYPFLFLPWSWIHPSYVLGILSLAILYGGLLGEQLWQPSASRHSSKLSTSLLCVTLALLLSVFITSWTYSPQVKGLYTTLSAHVKEALQADKKENSFSSPNSSLNNSSPLLALTKPIWGNNALPLSGDFTPTWQVIHHPAAESSLLLCCIAFLLLICTRVPNRFGMTALLLLTTYFGFCYLRGTGYATIAATFVIASALSNLATMRSQSSFLFNKKIFVINLLLALGALLGVIKLVVSEKNESFFMEKGRVFGFGKIATFDDAAYLFVKTHFPEVPCFTTMVTGSYASFLWKNDKKVFIDSFFAPHPSTLWSDYKTAVSTHNSSLLDHYGVQVAIVENSNLSCQALFLTSQDWRPVAISLGATVYQKGSVPVYRYTGTDPFCVELLFTQAEVERCHSPTTRRALAAAYYNSILNLQLHHLGKSAENLIHKDEHLFETLVNYLDPSQQRNIRQEPKGIAAMLLRP
ncbi:MAG: DUF2339 domain-containing protein [Chthoniobacterales bacterium]|nr:DUF2339 domain-containing protein [Chthoniobacterales bacterium]